jgi:fumarate hydratase, class II
MITSYATLKKAVAKANYAGKRLDSRIHKLIVQVCDEILDGQYRDMFPLHVGARNDKRHCTVTESRWIIASS